jgi:N-acetylglucosamine-6-phosphate deacetylase
MFVHDLSSTSTLRLEISGHQAVLTPAGSISPPPGLFLSPGWVDLQVNGFAGLDLNSPDLQPEHVGQMVRRFWAEGVAAVYPTIITAAPGRIDYCLRQVAAACEQDAAARAAIPGIHLEGPYLSPADGTRGVHPAEHIHPPDWDEFARWQEAAGGRIRIVTLAPEQPGSVPFIERLVRAGIVVAVGHSDATTAQLADAVAAGATLSTHLGNGIRLMLRRHPNPIWDQLADDRLCATAIFDGFHLPDSVMRVLLRAKGPDRLILVSDAVALARMPPGVYDTPVGGKVELHANGHLTQYASDYLAGSASSLRDAVETALRLGCSPAEVARLVAHNPDRAVPHPRPQSHTLFRWDPAQPAFTVLATLVEGQAVYRAPELTHYL